MSTEKSVKNLHTRGVGFINRLRWVEARKGKPYLCVAIGAQYGVADENGHFDSSLYDLRVVTDKAIEAVTQLEETFKAGNKIYVDFLAGDTRAEAFQYKTGTREGEWGASIKGTLLQVRGAWVDGERVIDSSSETKSEHGEPAQSAAESEDTPVVSSDSQSAAEECSAEQSNEAPTDPSPEVQPTEWRAKLELRPGRILVLKTDPEAMDKILAINGLGCYDQVEGDSDDRVVFVLKQSTEAA